MPGTKGGESFSFGGVRSPSSNSISPKAVEQVSEAYLREYGKKDKVKKENGFFSKLKKLFKK
jgi:hypothetical protein